MPSAFVSILVFVTAFGAAYAVPGAQAPAKKALAVDDYTKWKNIAAPELSADGKWLTYGLALTNTAPTESKPVLHLLNLQTNETVQVADATGGAFSADSAWLAYTVDPGAAGAADEEDAEEREDPEGRRSRRRAGATDATSSDTSSYARPGHAPSAG